MTVHCPVSTQPAQSSASDLRIDMDRLSRFFREKYPTGTAASVAADLNVSLRTVEAWLASSPREPRGALIIKAIWVYGPEFLAVLLPEPPAWLSEAAQNEADARLRDQINALKAQMKR